MSVGTFVKWVFSWMSQMKIDFRKQIDPWCKYEPKMLACDGTHVGVALKNMNLQNPITKADNPEQRVTPNHKRSVYICSREVTFWNMGIFQLFYIVML